MTTFGLYLRDLSHQRTRSHGIVNYALGLTRSLPAALAPSERLVVYANSEMAAELGDLPGNVRLTATAPPPRGVARLYDDHIAALWTARRDGVPTLHFPKGFVPAVNPTRVRTVATIHDDIPLQYWQGAWGADHRNARVAYFAWAIGHAARAADLVLTVSDFTRTQLCQRWPGSQPRVTHQGITLPATDFVPVAAREPVAVHFGSVLPHKRSIDGLSQLLRWIDEHPAAGLERIHVTGTVPKRPGVSDHPRVSIVNGPLSNADVARLVCRARAVLFPSAYEGFGLPPLEATILGTPVVHARIPAVMEVLGPDAPGGYDAESAASFDAAVERALESDDDDLRSAATAAAARFDWAAVAAATLDAYREVASR